MKLQSRMSQGKLWLFVVVVAVVIGVVGYRQYDSWRTNQKFNALEQDIDVLKAELEKQGIQDVSKNKYCLRDGEKFGGGQLRCEISLGFIGEKSNILSLLGSMNFIVTSSIENSRIELEYKENKVACFLDVDEIRGGVSSFEFYCIDAVNKPIYPVVE